MASGTAFSPEGIFGGNGGHPVGVVTFIWRGGTIDFFGEGEIHSAFARRTIQEHRGLTLECKRNGLDASILMQA